MFASDLDGASISLVDESEKACYLTEQETVELSLSVSLANFWNRVAGGFRRQPQAR